MTRISEDGASMSAIYRHIGVLRLFYDFLNLGGVVSYVAPRLVKLRCPPKQPTPLLSDLEVQRLIAATKTPRERALVEFLYGTGCRLSEATHLKVEDLDLVGRTARVAGKFRKVRIVLLTATATEALRAYVGNRGSGYIFQPDRGIQKGCLSKVDGCWVAAWTDYGGPGPKFPHERMALGRVDLVSYESARKQFNSLMKGVNLVHPLSNHPLCNVSVEEVLRRVGERAGLKKVSPHMLRRSFATHLYDHGAGLEVVQALLGHRYMQTTALYTRLSTGRILKTFQKCHPREKMNENASQ
jgi:integrase/recombinase XerD